jgi:hypothetical protein
MQMVNRSFESKDVKDIKGFSQTQTSLTEQLQRLVEVANRLGLYDAASFVRGKI